MPLLWNQHTALSILAVNCVALMDPTRMLNTDGFERAKVASHILAHHEPGSFLTFHYCQHAAGHLWGKLGGCWHNLLGCPGLETLQGANLLCPFVQT